MGEAEQASCREGARLVGGRVLVDGLQTQPLHPSYPHGSRGTQGCHSEASPTPQVLRSLISAEIKSKAGQGQLKNFLRGLDSSGPRRK